MDKGKNEFIFGFNEIFAIFKRKIKLIIIFLVLSLALGVGNFFLQHDYGYIGNHIIYTDYQFSNDNFEYEQEVKIYKDQISSLVDSLNKEQGFYFDLVQEIEKEKINNNVNFKTPSVKKLMDNFNFSLLNGNLSFNIKYQGYSKDETYIILSSAIKITNDFAKKIYPKIIISNYNDNFSKEELISYYSLKSSLKIVVLIFAFGIILSYLLEIFNSKIRFEFVTKNIVKSTPLYSIDKDETMAFEKNIDSLNIKNYLAILQKARNYNYQNNIYTCLASSKNENKSKVLVNLAFVNALSKKTLIIDLDFLNPTIHKLMNLNLDEGISEYINGEKNCYQIRKKINDKLDVITCGKIYKDDLIHQNNKKIKELIDKLKADYECIFVDVPDAETALSFINYRDFIEGYFIVVKNNITYKKDLKNMMLSIEENKINTSLVIYLK